MARLTWFDRLTQLTRPGQAAGTPSVPGLVLSGGGARASFHIGALRYLYDQVGIAPTRIVGTSAGSVVAAVLAQSVDSAEQSAQLRDLERTWLSMTGPADMFAEQAWFTKLRSHWDDLSGLTGLLAPGEGTGAESVVVADADEVTAVVRRAMAEDPSQDMAVTPNDVWQLAGSLLRVGRAGAGLAASVRGAEKAASAYRPGPIVERLLFESDFESRRVAQSGVLLRLAFVDLNSGELRYMRQDGVIVDREDRPIDGTRYDLTLGVWASCAIPGVFRPVKMGAEVYVDGGVRDNVPVEMAVTHLGVTKPYVIVASPPGLAADDFAAKDMVSVLLRVAGITLDETIRNEVEWARRAGACVIEPRVDVHDAGTVEPALLRINRDYGWMCAAEEIQDAPPSLRTLNDSIISARCEWAAIEHPSHGAAAVSVGGVAPTAPRDRLDQVQRRLRDFLARSDPSLMPPGHESWADALM